MTAQVEGTQLSEKTFMTMDQIDLALRSLRRATAISTMVAGPDDGSNEPPSFTRDSLFASMQIVLEELETIHGLMASCGKEG